MRRTAGAVGAGDVFGDAEILDEDLDRASRCVIALDDVWAAVLKHPRAAGGVGNDLVNLSEVQAQPFGKSQRLAGGGYMHPGEKLIDHLERRAGANLLAQMVDRLCHRLQDRPGSLVSCTGTGDEKS